MATAVRHAEDSTSIVEDGMNRTHELRKSFENIGASVSELFRCSREIGQAIAQQISGARRIEEVSAKLSDLTRQINAATQEQSNGTEQVVSAIEQIRGMAHTNVKSATDLASSADQLSRQAEIRRDWSRGFR